MLDKLAIDLFVLVTVVLAIPNVDIAPPTPVKVLINSQQQFTCTITVQNNWRSVTFEDSSVTPGNIATFINLNDVCDFLPISDGFKDTYGISCGTTLGTFHLTVKNVTEKHNNKTVKCTAQYGTGISTDLFYSSNSSITVIIPLENVNIFPNTTPTDVERDEIQTFTCSASSRPFTSIMWKIKRKGQPFEDLTPHIEQFYGSTVTSYLNYTGNTLDEGAVILCIGQYNETEKDSTIIELRIIFAPDTDPIIDQTPRGNIFTGDNVTLNCSVSGGHPLPKLFWNCTGIMTNTSTVNKSSYSMAFTVNKSYNNKICTCFVDHYPVNSYRPKIHHRLVVFYQPDQMPLIEQNPASLIFADQNVTLICTLSGGNPLPMLEWNCTGTNHNNTIGIIVSYSVTFTVSNMDNNKICVCSATQLVTSYTSHADHTLIVYYAPDNEPSIQWMPDIDLQTGDNVTLTCTVLGGNPLAILSWNCTGYNTNNTIGNIASYSVAFSVNKTYNSMICACSATHLVSSYRPSVEHKLVVYYGPGMPEISIMPKMPWFEGNRTSLLCIFEDGNPKASIQWKMGNQIAESNNNRSIFTFDALTKDDNEKQILCTVYNTYSKISSTITVLDVQYVPNIMVEKTLILTNESKSISLSCNASGNPVPYLKWKKNKQDMNLLTANRSILNIENINRTDNGNYTCEASSNSSTYGKLVSIRDTQVVVNYAPVVTVTMDKLHIIENSQLTLTCNAAGKPSEYAYGWKHTFAGKVIRVFNSNTDTILLQNVSYQDVGRYECAVNNGITDRHGTLNQTNNTVIEIQYKPVFILFAKVITGKKGRNVSVSVEFISFPDISKPVRWRNSTENSLLVNSSKSFMTLERKFVTAHIYNISVPFKTYGYTSSLHFPNFDEYQEGLYDLEVINTIGVSNVTMRIVFSDRPEKPKLFSANGISSTIVTLTWEEGFNGGNNQTFIITYWKMNSVYKTSVNVSERSDKKYEVEISDLIPSTSYMFQLIAKNEEGYSDSVNNTIVVLTKDKSEMANSVIGPVAGAVGAIVAAGIFVVGIFVLRRKYLASGQNTDRKNLTFTSQGEDDEDGLKDNELYVSADANLTATPGDVYAVVKKHNDKKPKGTHIQETVLYAEVQKKKDESKAGEVSKNVKAKQTGKQITKEKLKKKKGISDDVYENVTDQNAKQTLKNKNKDGLVYADLVFNEDGPRKFIIRGIENKNDYADIDLDLKADPLPSDDSDDEKDKVAENGDLNVAK